MTIKYFFYENPGDTRIVKIKLRDIEQMAESLGDYRLAEEMDEESFYEYCDSIIFARDSA